MKKATPITLDTNSHVTFGLEHFEEAHEESMYYPGIEPTSLPQATQVMSYDPFSGKVVTRDASIGVGASQQQLYLVMLSTGREVLVDGSNNSIYGLDVDDPSKVLRPFTPEEVRERRIVVPFVKDLSGFLPGTKLSSIDVTDDSDCHFHSMNLDYDFGWALGALAGNGWWDKEDRDFRASGCWPSKRSIYLADLKQECSVRLHQFFDNRLCRSGVTPHYTKKEQKKSDHSSRYGDTVKHTYLFPGCEAFCDFLTDQLGGQRDEFTSGAANKHLPPFFLVSPQEFRRGLLCGLVDTDGSCSVSNAKGKPQLQCQFSSTSLRLCQEVALLCRTLGIEATITFSKATDAGNTLWVVSMSAPDCKRLGVFRDLANTHKRNAFLETHVSPVNTSLKFTRTVLPADVAARVRLDLLVPKIRREERDIDTREMKYKKHLQAVGLAWSKGCEEGIVSRQAFRRAVEAISKWTCDREVAVQNALYILQQVIPQSGYVINREQVIAIREALLAIVPKQDTQNRLDLRTNVYSTLNAPLRKGSITPKAVSKVLEWIQSTPIYQDATHDPDVRRCATLYPGNKAICWARVKSIVETGEVGLGPYCLAVPSQGNFMDSNGVFVGTAFKAEPYAPATAD